MKYLAWLCTLLCNHWRQVHGGRDRAEEEVPGFRVRLLQNPSDQVLGDVCSNDDLPAVFLAGVFQEDQPCGEFTMFICFRFALVHQVWKPFALVCCEGFYSTPE